MPSREGGEWERENHTVDVYIQAEEHGETGAEDDATMAVDFTPATDMMEPRGCSLGFTNPIIVRNRRKS